MAEKASLVKTGRDVLLGDVGWGYWDYKLTNRLKPTDNSIFYYEDLMLWILTT